MPIGPLLTHPRFQENQFTIQFTDGPIHVKARRTVRSRQETVFWALLEESVKPAEQQEGDVEEKQEDRASHVPVSPMFPRPNER